MKLVRHKSSVAIKNGNRDGTTEFAHKFKPFFAAIKLSEENIIKKIVKGEVVDTKSTTFDIYNRNNRKSIIWKINGGHCHLSDK